ncbi:hypothetical protein [Shimazuella kribbensis]|uniref:hypothetical protein n=1 Tax=Shimazuella kribbensis TaxID=139808 RepID=UPI0012EC2635|nr:hypothetical protein [Shimazuella kribbensis]
MHLLNSLPWLSLLAMGAILSLAASVYMCREALRSRECGAYAAVKVSVAAALASLVLSIFCVLRFILLIT